MIIDLPSVEAPRVAGKQFTIVYDPVQVRGSEIVDKLKESEEYKNGLFEFKIEDIFEENGDGVTFSEFTKRQLITLVVLNIFNLAASFVTDKSYVMYPENLGIFSYYFMVVSILTMISVYVVALSIYKKSFTQLYRNSSVDMMTLVSIGSGLALVFGMIYTFLGIFQMFAGTLGESHYIIMKSTEMFFTTSTILTAVVVGKFIEGKIKKAVSGRIDTLKTQMKVSVDFVTKVVLKNRKYAILSTEEVVPMLIEKDDYILVHKKGMIPFDGFVETGSVKIVENIQFGWEKVETKTKGHHIMSGSQVIDAEESTLMRVTEPLEKTLAGRLFFEIKEATSGSSSDKKSNDILSIVTKYFITVVMLVAVITFVGWCVAMYEGITSTEFSKPFEKAIAVLVAACPCALGIAVPMVYAIALRKGLRAGVLIKDTASLDVLHQVDSVIFDKTGTITGTFNIKEVNNVTQKYDDSALWEIVSFLEKEHLQHPVGLALYQEALQRVSKLEKSKFSVSKSDVKTDQEYVSSEGVIDRGILIDNVKKTACLGNVKILKRLGVEASVSPHHIIDISSPTTPLTALTQCTTEPNSPVDLSPQISTKKIEEKGSNIIKLYLIIDNEVQFEITLSLIEDLKNNVVQLMNKLRQKGKDIYIMSGDSRENANEIGIQLGIPVENIYAELTPEKKESNILRLTQELGKKVMMVGDGINDIKAFKAATLSCSINFKSSQNLTFSDFIIIDNDVENISGLFDLASILTKFKILILACALLYNIPTILAATGAFETIMGIDLPAFMAAWAMVASSVLLTLVANLMEFFSIKQESKGFGNFAKQLKRRFTSDKSRAVSMQKMQGMKQPLLAN